MYVGAGFSRPEGQSRLLTRSERHARAEGEKAHLVEGDICNLAEQCIRRIEVWALPLLTIEDILRVDAKLQLTAATGAETAHDRQVREHQGLAADTVDPEGERACLKGGRCSGRVP